MINQPNKIVVLEWLLPLLNQQLSQVAGGWQVDSKNAEYEQMALNYHRVSGALIMINLPLLANLADKLSLLAGAGSRQTLSADYCQVGQFSHYLLQHEMTQGARTDTYQTALLYDTTDELSQILAQIVIATEEVEGSPSLAIDTVVYDTEIPVPNMPTPNRVVPAALTAQSVLGDLSFSADSKDINNSFDTGTDTALHFLARILSELETIIFALDMPHTLLNPLQQIRAQLEGRGWVLYAEQVTLIMTDIEHSLLSKAEFVQAQWQIECQLQELYSAIYNTEQTIQTKIGHRVSFVLEPTITPEPTNLAPSIVLNSNQQQTSVGIDKVPSDNNLYQLRAAVAEVKSHFDEYIQRQQTHLLPTAEDFIKISSAFVDMGLPSVCQVTDTLATVFTKLLTHNTSTLSKELTQTLADVLTSVELFLDYLAQQIFDQQLLTQAKKQAERAVELLDMRLQSPDTINNDTFISKKQAATTVVCYDDNGEIDAMDQASDNQDIITPLIATSTSNNDPALEDNSNEVHDVTKENDIGEIESDALRHARTQVQSDDFDMDEEIRDIFVEEALEVIADLEKLLPIWQQDVQDLTPITEMRRGFHTLKGSGRMVGAFSISETAWPIEDLLNQLLKKTLPVTEDVVGLVIRATKHLSILVTDFETLQSPSIDPAITILQSHNLRTNKPLNFGLSSSVTTEKKAEPELSITVVEAETGVNIEQQRATTDGDLYQFASSIEKTQRFASDDAIDNEVIDYKVIDNKNFLISLFNIELPAVLVSFIQQTSQLPTDTNDADPNIKEIFIEEAYEVLAEITLLYEQWQDNPIELTPLIDIRRGFHTLKGSGRMVGANYTGELAGSIENLLARILDRSINATKDIRQLVTDILAAYPTLVTTFANSSLDYLTTVPLWIACANAYSQQYGDEFSYCVLYAELVASAHYQPIDRMVIASNNNVDTINRSTKSNNDVDNMLQKIHSVNELMAETSPVFIPKSEEEQEFYEVFIEEAEALLQDINEFVSVHQGKSHINVSDDIVRAFHTLRAASGSSALAAISDVSAIIEQNLEQLQNHDTPMGTQHLEALTQSVALINGYLNKYKKNLQQQNIVVEEVQSQQDLTSLQVMLGESDNLTTVSRSHLSIVQLLDQNIDELLDAEWQLSTALNQPDIKHVKTYIQQQILQIERLATKTAESPKFIAILDALRSAYTYLNNNLQLADNNDIKARLLAGHAQLIGLFDSLAGSMSLKVDPQVLKDLYELSYNSDSDSDDNSSDSKYNNNDKRIATSSINTVTSTAAPELQLESTNTDVELLEIFLEEVQELEVANAKAFNEWRADITDIETIKVLQRHLHTIKGGARMVGIRSIADLAHEAESIYEAFIKSRQVPTTQWLAIMEIVQDILSLQIKHIAHYQTSFFATELIEQLRQFEQAKELPVTVNLILPALNNHVNTKTKTEAVDNGRAINKMPDTLSLDLLIKESWGNRLPDPDILEVFLEEAEELTNSNRYLQQFLHNVSDTVALQSLQRDLHTLKGGARMVAANGIADLAHEMETVYEGFARRRRPATKKILELLVVCHDWLAEAVFILKQHVNPPTPTLLIVALEQFTKHPDSLKNIPNESLQVQRKLILAAKDQQDSKHIEADISEMPSMTGNFIEQEQSLGSNEMIRISGSLIEHMINLSGESAINRARIDIGISSLTNSIEDMGITVQRLADQLRRMEIELEIQILSQIDEELIKNKDFDPLEMDQYSSLNQLSKSLSESASDLIDINSTLLEKTRDSESLLLQLSRTQNELQDGLMNSRMVPFNRLTPRLERIVRQTANELNKSVELTIINPDDEMDRTILERITSPLEHMLRNAVDHGIESTATRIQAGKDRKGRITLEVLREGSEIVINLSDDGRGIDVKAVRDKAISQGLIEAQDNSLTDLDVMQYIFNAGLSTVKEVTQISGRGVGMDIVISEIRQLGGVVSVMSDLGQGSHFTIRVPFTVAVSDALVVRAADRYYAIPLVQIERVVRINPEILYDYYQASKGALNLEGTEYRVRYLNEILSGHKFNELMVNTNTSLPLILIKNRTGHNIALQVDQIAGSRIEVVVKPLGRQLSHLAGISAATIMGDGSVMLILDLIALMRNAPNLQKNPQAIKSEHNRAKTQLTILVVDDSVTVRKVTSRFLERQGINVTVAKDGIDAIEILQETTPDLILLDIEMPRMDGFEVATQVRHNKRLQHIPIIMITSRTGEKHRERALEVGVNDYMGKPFRENQLLNKIYRLLGKQVSLNDNG